MLAETRTSTAARAHARLGRPRPIARDAPCWLCAACRTPRVMLHARCCTSQPTRLAQPLNRLHEVGLRVVRPRPPVVPMSNRRRLYATPSRCPFVFQCGGTHCCASSYCASASPAVAARSRNTLDTCHATCYNATCYYATVQLCNMLQCNSLGEPGRCRSLEEHQRS